MRKLLYLIPLLGLVALVSYIGDPAEISQSGRYEWQAATILLKGNNLTGAHDCNERLLQRYFIEGLNRPCSVVVIGSSRSMQINSNLFKGRTFFNSSVSGATLEDYLGIYELYRRRGMLPTTLVLGLDPWILNKNNGQTRWQTLSEPFYALKNRLGFAVPSLQPAFLTDTCLLIERYAEMVSPAYFQASLKVLFRRDKKPDAVNGNVEAAYRRSDGSIRYDKKTSERTIAEVNKEATQFINNSPVYSLGRFDELDAGYLKLLETFITLLVKDKVEIVFFLAPYHPKVYQHIQSQYRMVIDAETYFRTLAGRYGIKVIGSYNPRVLHLDETSFYDGMHPKQEAVEGIFNSSAGKDLSRAIN